MIPGFIIAGAPRAGTTSLYHYLRQHPQVCMSRIKETDFFAFVAAKAESAYEITSPNPWPVTSWKQYQAMFDCPSSRWACGEASPRYLYTPGVPRQIKERLPDVKLIFILRNPIERAYSSFLKNVREGIETRPFRNAYMEEMHRPGRVIRSDKTYLRAGLYFQRLSEYFDYFDRAHVLACFYDQLKNEPARLLKAVHEFIGVNPDFKTDTSVKFNKSAPFLIKDSTTRRNIKSITGRMQGLLPQRLYFFLLKLQQRINARFVSPYPELNGDDRLILRDYFSNDVEKLQKMLGRDLSAWVSE